MITNIHVQNIFGFVHSDKSKEKRVREWEIELVKKKNQQKILVYSLWVVINYVW